MDKEKFCEAMYALQGDVVVRRRPSVVVPVLVFVAGAAMLIANAFLPEESEWNDMRAILVLAGGIAVIVGFVMFWARMAGNGVPYHRPSHSYLHEQLLMFEASQRDKVLAAVLAGDWKGLLSLPRRNISAVSVLFCATPDGSFVAMQPFEYAELEYRPLCDVKIVC